MRKLIAITLLVIFGLPFASSLFALTPKSEDNLPACCRRAGKHHCMMSMAERGATADRETHFSAPADKCPYASAALVVGHHPSEAGVPSAQGIFVGHMSQPAVIEQAESMRRISRDRSRQKRGPPALQGSL